MVLVYGANGKAGHLVARGLGDVRAAGRGAAMPEVLAGVRLVVNCAGPIVHTARPLAEACIAAGVHYLDISGERASVRDVLALDLAARRAGVTIVPSAGAKGALGSWAMSLIDARTFDIAYAHAGSAYWRPSPGALLSVAHDGVEWEAARTVDEVAPRAFDFPAPFARGFAVPRNAPEELAFPGEPVRRVRAYLAVDPGTQANVPWGAIHDPFFGFLTRPTAPVLWRALIALGPKRLALWPPGDGALAMVVEPDREEDALAVSARDGYGATVAIVKLCARAILRGGRSGVLSPAQLVPAREAFAALTRSGVIRVFRDGRSRRSRPAPAHR